MSDEDSLRDVYRYKRASNVISLGYVSEVQTFLVGEYNEVLELQEDTNEWRKTHRVRMQWSPEILCALVSGNSSDSRVL